VGFGLGSGFAVDRRGFRVERSGSFSIHDTVLC